MNYMREEGSLAYYHEDGDRLAYINFQPSLTRDQVVVADHIYLHPSLRGQGIAEDMVDEFVAWMVEEDQQIMAMCSYIAQRFQEDPDKYDAINANR